MVRRQLATLGGVFGALAMLVAALGLFGLLVLSLAVGIGATAAIFSVINGVLLRSLAAVREPDRLVLLARVMDDRPQEIPFMFYEALRDRPGA